MLTARWAFGALNSSTNKKVAEACEYLKKGSIQTGRKMLIKEAYDDASACYLLAMSYLRDKPRDLTLAKEFIQAAISSIDVIMFPLDYFTTDDIFALNIPAFTNYIVRFSNFNEHLENAFNAQDLEKPDQPKLGWLINHTLDYLAVDTKRKIHSKKFMLLLIYHGTEEQKNRALTIPSFIKSLTAQQLFMLCRRETELPHEIFKRILYCMPEVILGMAEIGELLNVTPSLTWSLMINDDIRKKVALGNLFVNVFSCIYHQPLKEHAYGLINKKLITILLTMVNANRADALTVRDADTEFLLLRLLSDTAFIDELHTLLLFQLDSAHAVERVLRSFYAHVRCVNDTSLRLQDYFSHDNNIGYRKFQDEFKADPDLANSELIALIKTTPKEIKVSAEQEGNLSYLVFRQEYLFPDATEYQKNFYLSILFNALRVFLTVCVNRPHAIQLLWQPWFQTFVTEYQFEGITDITAKYVNVFAQLFQDPLDRKIYYATMAHQNEACSLLMPAEARSALLTFIKIESELEADYQAYLAAKITLDEFSNRQKIHNSHYKTGKETIPKIWFPSIDLSGIFDGVTEALRGVPSVDAERKEQRDDGRRRQGKYTSEYFMTENDAAKYLGLAFPTTPQDLKTAYKTALRSHHPDKNAENQSSTVRAQKIIDAYAFLNNYLQNPGNANSVVEDNSSTRMDNIAAEMADNLLKIGMQEILTAKVEAGEKKISLLALLAIYVPHASIAYMQELKKLLKTDVWKFIDVHASYGVGWVKNTDTRDTVNQFLERRIKRDEVALLSSEQNVLKIGYIPAAQP